MALVGTKGEQNFVRDPNMFRSDISLQRRLFIDACLHSGYKVEYFEAEQEKRDFYRDPVVRWKEAVILPCIFEDFPKPKILKELGWFTPDQETQSQILYLPMYKSWETKEILDLKDQSLFRITYFGQNYPADFRLMEKRQDTFYGVYWIVRLAPEHLDNFYYITDHGSHYLKRKKNPENEVSEHKEHKEESKVDKRVYQNEDLEAYLFGKSSEQLSDNRPFSDEMNNKDEWKSYSQLIMEDDDD